jgi:hypothetical protein
MDWSDQPAGPPAPASPSRVTEPASSPAPVLGGPKRLLATTLLAIGLLGIGGAAVVFAADPSATPAPSAATTPNGSGGTTAPSDRPNGQAQSGQGHAKGDCPNMGGTGGSGGSGGPTAPSTAPSTDGSTSSPSTSDL